VGKLKGNMPTKATFWLKKVQNVNVT